MIDRRYSRQVIYENIGEEGQQRLLDATVAIIGMGALGTVSANNLCRAGVGRLKLIDRDYVELSNLQRQTLYNEDDVREEKPKAMAAFDHLSRVNSSIRLEPVIADVSPSNIEEIISGCDLVLDCTDNFEVRRLINEACDRMRIPWIYCGAIGSTCMTMNIIPGETPCFLCFSGESSARESGQTCSTVGVLNMATGIASSMQTAEAVKLLTGSPDLRRNLFFMDVWENIAQFIDVKKDPECPVCVKHEYTSLGKPAGSYSTHLCGRNEIQVVPNERRDVDFGKLAASLSSHGEAVFNSYMLKFTGASFTIKLFRDGRAIIGNAKDASHAKSIYTEYIGF
jgi:adenylyltransferase/sulfurtransferase